MQALSQLSYGPMISEGHCSPEFKLARPPHSETLIVLGWPYAQADLRTSVDYIHGNEVALVELGAICRESIDLVGGIDALEYAISRSTGRVSANHDDALQQRSPFAL